VPSQTATVTPPDVAIGPEPGPVDLVTGSDATGPVQGTATQGVQGPATDPLAGLGDLSDLGYSDAAFGQPVDPATAARMEIGQTEILKATDPNAFNRQQLKGALERQGVLTDTQIQSELDATVSSRRHKRPRCRNCWSN
jgi:hypothetical protein